MADRWYMSDKDILRDYREAKNKVSQIGILADRNLTTKAEVIGKLRELGVEIEQKQQKKSNTKTGPQAKQIDEETARALVEAGKKDSEIAAALGVSEKKIRSWRKKNGIEKFSKRKKKKEDSTMRNIGGIGLATESAEPKSQDEEKTVQKIAEMAAARIDEIKKSEALPVVVADKPEGLTAGALGALLEKLEEMKNGTTVNIGGKPVNGVTVMLHYTAQSAELPESVSVELEAGGDG